MAEMTVPLPDFGLADWPRGGRSVDHAVHVAYLRAARRAGALSVAYVSPSRVATRDGWACSACGGPVLQRWTAAEVADAPALAYVKPIEDGGAYSERNLRLAHQRCALADGRLAAALRQVLGGPPARPRSRPGDTHCGAGHELAGANLLKSSDGRRRCRQCRNDRERKA